MTDLKAGIKAALTTWIGGIAAEITEPQVDDAVDLVFNNIGEMLGKTQEALFEQLQAARAEKSAMERRVVVLEDTMREQAARLAALMPDEPAE